MRQFLNKKQRITSVLFLMLIIGGTTVYGLWLTKNHTHHSTDDSSSFNRSGSTPSSPPEESTSRIDELDLNLLPQIDRLNRPLSFLIVGVDERQDDTGRTDTIIVFTANPEERTIKMVSIPRDTKTVLADVSHNFEDKINHAYSRGKGISSTKKTVEQFLGIPIDYTASINMQGFEQLIDIFGGVEVDVPRDFTIEGHHYIQGPMTLDGHAALYYVRERESSNDFDRNFRQQQVVRALIDKSTQFSTLTRVNDIMNIIGKNVDTNLTPVQLFYLQRLYGNVKERDIERLELTGTDEWSDAYYFIVDNTSKAEVTETLRAHLQFRQTESAHSQK